MATDAILSKKNDGKTVPAVRIGCHAGSRCCLKALAAKHYSKLNHFF
jgi:hypothetical protein